jgi:putative protein-disulfide isomerase
MADPTPNKEIILFADPMCSWCWGFSPVMGGLAQACDGRARYSLVLGGLRPGTTDVMDDHAKTEVRHHWEHVAEASGQPFTFAFFERDDFVYDTEPACRAVVAVRRLASHQTFAYLDALHRAFYAENRDITDPAVLADVAAFLDIDAVDFMTEFQSDATRAETLGDFRASRELGVTGYPTVVLRDEGGLAALTIGYQPLEDLAGPLETWLQA